MVPATGEAEVGGLLEFGRLKPIVPLHPGLGNRVRLCLKKKSVEINRCQVTKRSTFKEQ